MMKVLHLIPTLEGGGTERQLAMLAVEQARRGWSVHVACRRGGIHEDRMTESEVVIHPLSDLKSIHPLLLTRVDALARRVKPDILHTWLPQMDIVGGLVSLYRSIPWVLSERSSQEAYDGTEILTWVRCRLARSSKAVISNSHEGAKYWRSRLPAAPLVVTINNAVNVAAVRGAPSISGPGLGGKENTLLCVGRFEGYKAPEIFIQAIEQVSRQYDVHALLVGEGPLVQDIRTAITTLGLLNRIQVVPYQMNWWGWLKIATGLISPSRFEGQPNVVLEAMAAGCPLVVSDIPAHREILDESSALIVPKDNPTALAEAIMLLLLDPKAARRRAEHAFERIKGFTIQSTADAYERVYARVLTGRAN